MNKRVTQYPNAIFDAAKVHFVKVSYQQVFSYLAGYFYALSPVMKLSVIIVSYNVKYFLEQCLASVQQAITGMEAEVLVIDNCSKDGSVEYVRQRFPWVRLLVNKKNEGFAKANNIALEHCRGEYVLFLNPDTIIPEHILRECIAFLDTSADAGAIGVQMLDGSGCFLPESKRAFPSPFVSFFKLSGLSALFPKSTFFNRYALGNLDRGNVHVVDVLCGAFMMVRKDLLLKLNGFDQSFFMYGEDIDLSWRIQNAGKRNYYLGNLAIVHFKGESAGINKSRHIRMFYKAMLVFVEKHYTGLRKGILKTLLSVGIILRAVISFFWLPLRFGVKAFRDAFNEDQKNIYLIGDTKSTNEAEKILLKHKLQQVFKGALLIERKERFITTAGAEIIFCTGTLSYKDTIRLLHENPKNNEYRWHALHSGSITGSSNKKERGTIYFADNEKDNTVSFPVEKKISLNGKTKYADSSRNVEVSDTTEVS